MTTSMIRSLTLQPSATMGRNLGSLRRMFHRTAEDDWKGIVSDKQAKVEGILTLEGLEASVLKTLLPLVDRHFDASLAELRKVVYEHLDSKAMKGPAFVAVHTKVGLEGYDDSEKRILRPVLGQILNRPDNTELPKDTGNLKHFARLFRKQMF